MREKLKFIMSYNKNTVVDCLLKLGPFDRAFIIYGTEDTRFISFISSAVDTDEKAKMFAESLFCAQNIFPDEISKDRLNVSVQASLDSLIKMLETKLNADKAKSIEVATSVVYNSMPKDQAKFFLELFEICDVDIAESIRKDIFSDDKLVRLPDLTIQCLMREIDNEILAMILAGSSQELRDKIKQNSSKRLWEMLSEDIDNYIKRGYTYENTMIHRMAIFDTLNKLVEAGVVAI